jgi:hypothetical protein
MVDYNSAQMTEMRIMQSVNGLTVNSVFATRAQISHNESRWRSHRVLRAIFNATVFHPTVDFRLKAQVQHEDNQNRLADYLINGRATELQYFYIGGHHEKPQKFTVYGLRSILKLYQICLLIS